jgi:hypothetical protein
MHNAIYLKSSDDKKLLIQQLENGSAALESFLTQAALLV